jgi:replication factor C subunit 1
MYQSIDAPYYLVYDLGGTFLECSLAGLANSCYDLRFKRPNKGSIAARMMDIAKKEGLEMERNAIEMIIESVGNDIRQVIG